jgi:hypothetical protein
VLATVLVNCVPGMQAITLANVGAGAIGVCIDLEHKLFLNHDKVISSSFVPIEWYARRYYVVGMEKGENHMNAFTIITGGTVYQALCALDRFGGLPGNPCFIKFRIETTNQR